MSLRDLFKNRPPVVSSNSNMPWPPPEKSVSVSSSSSSQPAPFLTSSPFYAFKRSPSLREFLNPNYRHKPCIQDNDEINEPSDLLSSIKNTGLTKVDLALQTSRGKISKQTPKTSKVRSKSLEKLEVNYESSGTDALLTPNVTSKSQEQLSSSRMSELKVHDAESRVLANEFGNSLKTFSSQELTSKSSGDTGSTSISNLTSKKFTAKKATSDSNVNSLVIADAITSVVKELKHAKQLSNAAKDKHSSSKNTDESAASADDEKDDLTSPKQLANAANDKSSSSKKTDDSVASADDEKDDLTSPKQLANAAKDKSSGSNKTDDPVASADDEKEGRHFGTETAIDDIPSVDNVKKTNSTEDETVDSELKNDSVTFVDRKQRHVDAVKESNNPSITGTGTHTGITKSLPTPVVHDDKHVNEHDNRNNHPISKRKFSEIGEDVDNDTSEHSSPKKKVLTSVPNRSHQSVDGNLSPALEIKESDDLFLVNRANKNLSSDLRIKTKSDEIVQDKDAIPGGKTGELSDKDSVRVRPNQETNSKGNNDKMHSNIHGSDLLAPSDTNISRQEFVSENKTIENQSIDDHKEDAYQESVTADSSDIDGVSGNTDVPVVEDGSSGCDEDEDDDNDDDDDDNDGDDDNDDDDDNVDDDNDGDDNDDDDDDMPKKSYDSSTEEDSDSQRSNTHNGSHDDSDQDSVEVLVFNDDDDDDDNELEEGEIEWSDSDENIETVNQAPSSISGLCRPLENQKEMKNQLEGKTKRKRKRKSKGKRKPKGEKMLKPSYPKPQEKHVHPLAATHGVQPDKYPNTRASKKSETQEINTKKTRNRKANEKKTRGGKVSFTKRKKLQRRLNAFKARKEEEMRQATPSEPAPMPVCLFYLRGCCTKGTECPYHHEGTPTNIHEPQEKQMHPLAATHSVQPAKHPKPGASKKSGTQQEPEEDEGFSLFSSLTNSTVDVTVAASEKELIQKKTRGGKVSFNKRKKLQRRMNAFKARKVEEMRQATPKEPTPMPVCLFYLRGGCTKGAECQYLHKGTPTKMQEVCKYYVFNQCIKGDDCPFLHHTFPCKYHHSESTSCRHGDRCKFSHDALTLETKAMLDKLLSDQKAREQSGFSMEPGIGDTQNNNEAKEHNTSTSNLQGPQDNPDLYSPENKSITKTPTLYGIQYGSLTQEIPPKKIQEGSPCIGTEVETVSASTPSRVAYIVPGMYVDKQ